MILSYVVPSSKSVGVLIWRSGVRAVLDEKTAKFKASFEGHTTSAPRVAIKNSNVIQRSSLDDLLLKSARAFQKYSCRRQT
jgi:hypothetical protein